MAKFICTTHDENVFLESRKKFFTGSDIALIMSWLEDSKKSYYGRNIFEFTKTKLDEKEISSFQKKVFEAGHEVEDKIFLDHVKALKNKRLGKNNMYSSEEIPMLSCTTDIEVYDEKEKLEAILEIKSCNSETNQELYKNSQHPALYQCALQSLILGVPVVLLVHSANKNNESLSCFHEETIDKNHIAYQQLVGRLEEIEKMFERFSQGLEIVDIEYIEKDIVSKYLESSFANKKLDILKETIKNRISVLGLEVPGEKTFYKRQTKVYPAEFTERKNQIIDNNCERVLTKSLQILNRPVPENAEYQQEIESKIYSANSLCELREVYVILKKQISIPENKYREEIARQLSNTKFEAAKSSEGGLILYNTSWERKKINENGKNLIKALEEEYEHSIEESIVLSSKF